MAPAARKKTRAAKAASQPRAQPAAQPRRARTPTAAPDPRFAPVVKAFARDRQVTSGTMMASFGLKVNGKIFTMFVKGKFVAKLPGPRVDELVQSKAATRFDAGHGRIMKEWVELASHDDTWIDLAREAHQFVKASSR